MVKILNILSWLVSISIWIWIFAIDDDFFFLGLIIIFVIKFFLSKKFIEESIKWYKFEVEENFKKAPVLSNNTSKEIIEDNNKTATTEIIENVKEVSNIIKTPLPENKVILKEEVIETPSEPSKIAKFFTEFFAENLLAKIGWILLALWIIFLMSLVYGIVWPVAKIIIGFAVWFWVYVIWIFLDKKWFKTESLILFWTSLLINYIVILWGRYVIWDDDWLLSSGLTFLLLILNTTFSVLTSYLYSSKNILLFSIFFAYFIPFIVWSSWSEYSYLVVVFYSVVLSIWALFVSNGKYKEWDIITSRILFYFSVILWNLLVLASPLWNEMTFIVKVIWFNIITFSNIFVDYKNKFLKDLLPLFIISFVFLSLILGYWVSSLWENFNSIWIFISYFVWIIWILVWILFFMISWVWISLIYLLFAPILIITWLLFSSSLFWWIFLIPLFLLIYLWIFAFWIWSIISTLTKYVFFGVLWIFVTICNFYFIWFEILVDLKSFIAVLITAFIFLISTYYLSSKKDLNYLYTLWSLLFVLILLPIIKISWELALWSAIWVWIFWIINFLTPFFNSNLIKSDPKNLVLWSIIWIIFVSWNLYNFWVEYFPWVSLWLWFLALAVLYFIGWYIWFSKLDKKEISQTSPSLNFIYSSLWIAISLFSISVALIFSNNPLIISLIWILESTIVIFFSQKLNSFKALIAWIILLFTWIFKYFFTFAFSSPLNYYDLVTVIFVLASLILNIYFIKNSLFKSKVIIKILHIIWILFVYFTILEILDVSRDDYSLVFSLVFVWFLWIVYNLLKDSFLRITYLLWLFLLFILHIFLSDYLEFYPFNYLFTFVSWILLLTDYLFFKDKLSKFLYSGFWVYIFIITSLFLHHLTNDTFSLTIYWWILSLFLVHTWIWKNNKSFRWIWLYLLILTLIKISFYDVWNNIDNPIIRIIAFMFVWWIMMYISMLYSKNKLSLKEDFKIDLINESENIQK